MKLAMAATVALAAIVVLVNAFIARGQSACSSVLEAGLFNRISASPSSNYLEIKFALCLSYSGYTYNQYQQERATFDASKGASGANAYCTSQAFHFDVAASGLYRKGSARGGDKFSSSSECARNPAITFDSYLHLSERMFDQHMAHIKVYQQLSCATSGHVKEGSSKSVATLSEFVEPQVYQAYISCLNLLSSGIRFTQISSHDSRSLSIDLTYTPPPNNKDDETPALLNGFQQTGSATCTLQGPDLPPTSSSTLRAKLSPHTPYSIFCTLSPSTPKDRDFTDLFFHVSPGGTFHALLFHGSSPEDESPTPSTRRSLVTVNELATTVSKLTTTVNTLSTNLGKLTTTVTGLAKTVTANKAAFDAIYNARTGVLKVSTVSTVSLGIGGTSTSLWVFSLCGDDADNLLCISYNPTRIPQFGTSILYVLEALNLVANPSPTEINLWNIARKVNSLP